jgi:hypothetical protein
MLLGVLWTYVVNENKKGEVATYRNKNEKTHFATLMTTKSVESVIYFMFLTKSCAIDHSEGRVQQVDAKWMCNFVKALTLFLPSLPANNCRDSLIAEVVMAVKKYEVKKARNAKKRKTLQKEIKLDGEEMSMFKQMRRTWGEKNDSRRPQHRNLLYR